MKKVMLLMGFMVFVAFSFANESSNEMKENSIYPGKALIKVHPPVHSTVEKQNFSCTVTFKATVGPSFAKVEASCSSTKESCEEATTQAANCITGAIKRAMSMIEQ
jgi:hypothetical protein